MNQTCKIILVGDPHVGKTNLLQRLTDKEFTFDIETTIGVDFVMCDFLLDDRTVKAQVWDTAGQERFGDLPPSFYRDAVGVLLVYDTTYRATFKHLEKTLQKVREMTNAKIPIILVGNKCDKEYARSVPATEGKAFAIERRVAFIETSALKGTNVQAAFQNLIENIFQGTPNASRPFPSKIEITLDAKDGQQDGCC